MKKVLIIYHNNFLNNTLGCNSYIFEVVRHLKSRGCQIDFFSTDKVWDNFADFDDWNRKHGGIVTNFHLHRSGASAPTESFCFGERRYLQLWKFCLCSVKKACSHEQFGWVTPQAGMELQEMLDANHYDFVHVHYIQMAEILRYVRVPPGTELIYGAQDALYLMMGYYQFGLQGLLHVLPRELEVLKLFRKVFCISYDEMRFFKLLLPEIDFRFVPHMLPRRSLPSRKKIYDVLFLGFMNPHNKDAVKWFAEKVMPLAKRKWRVAVCGRVWWSFDKDEPSFNDFARKLGIERIEFAEDLDELYAKTRMSICPLLGGTGMKIKTIDSMARGIPVVSTSYGVDGFPDKLENGCLVADNPKDFAAHIDRMLADMAFYDRQCKKTRDYFDAHLCSKVVSPVLDDMFGLNTRKG